MDSLEVNPHARELTKIFSANKDISLSPGSTESAKMQLFLFLQIIHITQCGTKVQIFEVCFPNQFLQVANKSITLLGNTQTTPNDQKAKLHNQDTSPQCNSRWSTLSPLHLQRQHQSIIVKPLLLKWLVVRIFPHAIIQTKKTHDVEPSHPKYSSKEKS